ELRDSRVPEAVVSGSFRRLASAQGTLLRRAVPDATRAPLDVLPAGDRMAVAPSAPAPTGMVALADAAAAPPPEADERPAFAPDAVQARLLETLRPETTVVARAQVVVDAPAGTWERPDPLAPVSLQPTFPQPMLDGLAEVAPQLLLPGIG